MLADGMVRDPNKRQEYLETLSKESDRLTHMVENVLSFSQIERGTCKRETCEIRIGDTVNQLEPCLSMRLNEENMELDNALTKKVADAKVKVDPTSIDQILTNLVDNAAKYGQSSEGGGTVRISGDTDSKMVYIRVADNGRGIGKSDARRLFKAFHKSDLEAAHTKPGVGLGLALCRKLARSMGGDLSIVQPPEPSTGACFELRIPLV